MWNIFECRDALIEAGSTADLLEALSIGLRRLDAQSFSASRLFDDRPSSDSDHLTTLPTEALGEWSDRSAQRDDPVMQWLKLSHTPIYWDRDTYAQCGRDEMWLSLSRSGLSQGTGAVMHMPNGEHFLFGFDWADSRPRPLTIRHDTLAATVFLLPWLEQAERRVRAETQADQRSCPLSPRECECLRLVALGKTTWEISRILGISPHTTNKHIDSCVRKLNVSNRTHAATTAMRLGFL
jgi:DNA-binding CsgD family transcriptional regulator